MFKVTLIRVAEELTMHAIMKSNGGASVGGEDQIKKKKNGERASEGIPRENSIGRKGRA